MAMPVPLPAAPSFPLSSTALISWQRFAAKGGIGRAVGSQDQEALREEDLMFLEGDEITVLMDLGNDMYLGLCEDVVGCFFAESVTFTTKLKRPVLSSRLSSPTIPSPQPQPSAHSSHSEHEVEAKSSVVVEAEKQRKELEVLADEMDLGDVDDARARRRRTNAAGLGLGIENAGRVQGPTKGYWRQDAARSPSTELPGAFIPFPHSPSASSLATPSLVTSPSSDLDGSGSSNGHDAVTPPVPAWSPSVAIRGQSPARHPLAFPSPHSSDEPTDKFPIIENFPFPAPRSYTPTAANPLGNSPPRRSQPPPSPPTATTPPQLVVAPPTQALRSQFSDASLATTASRYKVSDGPSIDDMPHLPSTFSSPSSHQPSFVRIPKSSDASWRSDTSDGSGPNTPGGEDHTLAFIFDSYRYSMASVSTSTGNRTGSVTPESGPRSAKYSDGETERDEQEVLEQFESPVRNRLAPTNVHPSPFRFGAASDLRVRMEAMNTRGFDGDQDEELEVVAPLRSSPDSFEFDMANIPRLSTIFPRSSTIDSLASIRSSQSTVSSSSALSETIPVDNATAELDAARRLFDQHFNSRSDPSSTPRANHVASASPSSALPDSPTRTRTPNPRRKSIKGLVIGAPVIGSATGAPAWRAASNSPVQIATPRDVFGAANSPATPSSAASYVSSPMSQAHSPATPPSVTVQGASPAPPSRRLDYSDPSRTYYDDPNAPQLRGGRRPKLTIPSPDGEPAQYALHPPSASSSSNFASAASASTPTSPAFTVNSNSSSPSASSFSDEWRTTARERERSANGSLREPSHLPPANKLRKPNLRVKTQQQQQALAQSQVQTLNISSPISVDMAPSHSTNSLASLAGRDVVSSPPPPPTPSQQPPSPRRLNHKSSSKSLFARKNSGRAEGATQPNGAFPATKGISSKDFEDETVKLDRGVEFEMVKPLRDILQPGGKGQDGEEDDRLEELKSPTTPLGRPSLAASSRSYDDSGSSEGGHNDLRPPANAYSTHVNSAGRPLSIALDEQSIENHRAKELRWIKALGSMSPSAIRKSKKMRALVHAGIPSSVRGKVWCFLAGVEDVRIEGYYSTLCKLERLPIFDQIEADLAKTLHNHPQFAPDSVGREELCSVLKAFARYHSDLGYSPAMGFVGGLILSQVGDGELAFWTLVSLVKNWDMKQFFPVGRDELRISTLAFGFLLESAEPKLAKRFLELGIDPSMFLPRWEGSLFSDTLPWASALRITDLILFDSSYRLRVALAILELSQLDDSTNFPTRASILHWLHNLPPPSFAPALLLPTMHTIKLREDKVKKAYAKAEKTIRKAAKS